jgi:hypothetical protein
MTDNFVLRPPPLGPRRHGPRCCPECFEHEWIRAFVERESRQLGECDFCESKACQWLRSVSLTGLLLT